MSAASAVPASADVLSSPRPVLVKSSGASRLYHTEWLAAYRRARSGAAALFADGADSAEVHLGSLSRVDAAKATVNARVRALVAYAKREMRRAGIDPRKVHSRLRVRCAVKYAVITRRRTAQTGYMPALLQTEQASTAPVVVKRAVETCSVKLLLRRRTPAPATRQSFSITLPDLSRAQ